MQSAACSPHVCCFLSLGTGEAAVAAFTGDVVGGSSGAGTSAARGFLARSKERLWPPGAEDP